MITRQDCEQNDLDYYDGKVKKDNDTGQNISVSDNVELFGPEWDDIDLNKDVVQGSDESCEPENCTSEYTYVIKISFQSTHSTYDLYIQTQPQSFL